MKPETGAEQNERVLDDPPRHLRGNRPLIDQRTAGVPHPATYLLDRDGRVRFADVREDFHFWLDPELLREALARVP